jgi:hypothetical protein
MIVLEKLQLVRAVGSPDVMQMSRPCQIAQLEREFEHGLQEGTSGNPAGRRVEQERFATVLWEELASEIVTKIGHKKFKASVMRCFPKMLNNMALAGDKEAISALMRQMNRHVAEPTYPRPSPVIPG